MAADAALPPARTTTRTALSCGMHQDSNQAQRRRGRCTRRRFTGDHGSQRALTLNNGERQRTNDTKKWALCSVPAATG